jgi:penicillin-binding protein 1B
MMVNMMEDVIRSGTAASVRGRGFTAPAAGKTGTSRDGWFAGYTPNLVCVVWVGFDDNSELGLEGSKSALPIWAAFMKQALALRPDLGGDNWSKPDDVVSADIDPTSGLLAGDDCPAKRTEYFIDGTTPEEICNAHSGYPTDLPGLPPFEWPEGQEEPLPSPKKILREAEKAITDAQREVRRQVDKVLRRP